VIHPGREILILSRYSTAAQLVPFDTSLLHSAVTAICKEAAGRMILLGRPDPARGP